MIYRGTGFLAVAVGWYGSSPIQARPETHSRNEKERQLADERKGKGVDVEPNYSTARKHGPLYIIQYSLLRSDSRKVWLFETLIFTFHAAERRGGGGVAPQSVPQIKLCVHYSMDSELYSPLQCPHTSNGKGTSVMIISAFLSSISLGLSFKLKYWWLHTT